MWLLPACAQPGDPVGDPAPSATEERPSAPDSGAPPAAPRLLLNEAMPHNASVVMDEAGEREDWLELYAAEAVDLDGWTLQDGDVVAALPLTRLDAGEHLLLWADGEEGSAHLPFQLADGELLLLLDPTGAEADRFELPEIGDDLAWGRFPDGGGMQRASIHATPGLPNPLDPGMEQDPSELLFPDDEVLRIELYLPESSLEALRADAYSYAEGGLGFEAVWLAPIALRLKGQLGSARSIDEKCAFHIGLDEFITETSLRGQEHLTLNNMVQDPSFLHERLSYRLFEAFDVPAPRVAHAEVHVNGELRGLYLNVETPDEAFLARWFDDPRGNLYEGAYGPDLTEASYTSLQLDRDGEDVPPFSELAVLAALLSEEPSEARVAELEALVDLQRALDMWAVEVVTGHWDGYFYSPNNYRVYHDPSTGLLTLLPWGVDQTWGWIGDPHAPAGDLAVWALQIPSVRTRFDLSLWAVAEAVERLGLAEDAAESWRRIRPYVDADPYKEVDLATAESYHASTLDYLSYNPEQVLSEIFPDGVP